MPKDERKRKTLFYPLRPAAVFFLLERVVVWAAVILTQLSNTLLPESYVRAHLTSTSTLARYAVRNVPPDHKTMEQTREALKMVVGFVRNFLFWDFSFQEWLELHKDGLELYFRVYKCWALDPPPPRHMDLEFRAWQAINHIILCLSYHRPPMVHNHPQSPIGHLRCPRTIIPLENTIGRKSRSKHYNTH